MTYSAEIADEICERLGDGETLSQICRDDHMPERRSVFRWIDSRPAFAEMYATARLRQADKHYDELVEAARAARELTDTAKVQAARLHIDTLKWASARLRPEQYAEESRKMVKLDVGMSYSQLLESLDDRKPEMIDVTPDVTG